VVGVVVIDGVVDLSATFVVDVDAASTTVVVLTSKAPSKPTRAWRVS